jgi:hypothetical protein
MDVRVLRSLTTCGLYPYLNRDRKQIALTETLVHNGLGGANGAEFPAAIAVEVLDVPGNATSLFTIGFEFALGLAARITESPSHSPDLSRAIAEAKERLAEAIEEAA